MKKNCAVPDCDENSVCETKISINNEPMKLLPVCQIHFESALEDHAEKIKQIMVQLKK